MGEKVGGNIKKMCHGYIFTLAYLRCLSPTFFLANRWKLSCAALLLWLAVYI